MKSYKKFKAKLLKDRTIRKFYKELEPKREKLLAKILLVIKKKPGIRPSELNRLLKLEHSESLRNTLIKRGLVRKEKERMTVRYYSKEIKIKNENRWRARGSQRS